MLDSIKGNVKRMALFPFQLPASVLQLVECPDTCTTRFDFGSIYTKFDIIIKMDAHHLTLRFTK